jgi:ABC-type uncharacterized transport system substrate-binding protein
MMRSDLAVYLVVGVLLILLALLPRWLWRHDKIVTQGTGTTRAVQSATSTIPVVMTFVSDPVGQGFVNSLAQPGRNLTGLATLGPEISTKWLELVKEVAPQVARVGVLFTPALQGHRLLVQAMEGTAKAAGVALHRAEAPQEMTSTPPWLPCSSSGPMRWSSCCRPLAP